MSFWSDGLVALVLVKVSSLTALHCFSECSIYTYTYVMGDELFALNLLNWKLTEDRRTFIDKTFNTELACIHCCVILKTLGSTLSGKQQDLCAYVMFVFLSVSSSISVFLCVQYAMLVSMNRHTMYPCIAACL